MKFKSISTKLQLAFTIIMLLVLVSLATVTLVNMNYKTDQGHQALLE